MSCSCGRHTRDNAYTCDTCLEVIRRALGDCPWVDHQLEVMLTRQHAPRLAPGARSTVTPLPWHEKAGTERRTLNAVLAGWVAYCRTYDVRRTTNARPPADSITSRSAWLLDCVDGLAWMNLDVEDLDEIPNAVEQARYVATWKAREQVYLGPCRADDCPGEIYADPQAEAGICTECARIALVDQTRTALEAELDDRLCTAAEIARLSVYLGLDAPRDRVRKQVNHWHERRVITPVSTTIDDAPLFRYGDVRTLLSKRFTHTA